MSKDKMAQHNPSQRNEAQNNRGDHEKNPPKASHTDHNNKEKSSSAKPGKNDSKK